MLHYDVPSGCPFPCRLDNPKPRTDQGFVRGGGILLVLPVSFLLDLDALISISLYFNHCLSAGQLEFFVCPRDIHNHFSCLFLCVRGTSTTTSLVYFSAQVEEAVGLAPKTVAGLNRPAQREISPVANVPTSLPQPGPKPDQPKTQGSVPHDIGSCRHFRSISPPPPPPAPSKRKRKRTKPHGRKQ